MYAIKLISPFVLVLVFAANVGAQSRSSFWLERCAWNATDIVVATEGKTIDGRMTVLESWKGNHSAGEIIVLSELADFRNDQARLIKGGYYRTGSGELQLIQELEPFERVSGDRMILFLKKRDPSSRDPRPGAVWESAGDEGLRFSVMWVESDTTVAFLQIAVPGPNLLMRYGRSEDEVRDRTKMVLDAREALARLRLIPNKADRARALAPYAAMDIYQVSGTALEELRSLGDVSLPVLKDLLHDPSLLDQHYRYVETMAEMGGPEVAQELIDQVVAATVLWQGVLPTLKSNWSTQIDYPNSAQLHSHVLTISRVLYGLRKPRVAKSLTALTQLRDVLVASPAADDRELRRLIELCEELIRELNLDRTTQLRP